MMKQVPLTKKEKIAIVAGIGFLIVGYFAYQSFAGTTIGTSIKTRSNLTGSTDITSNLLGYWTFDGVNSQQNFVDSSGNGNNGFLVGTQSTSTVPGVVGQAMQFDGVDDYVNVGNSSSIRPALPVTIAAWVYLNMTPPGNAGIFTTNMTSFVAHNWSGIWFSLTSGVLSAQYGNNTACGPTGRRTSLGSTTLQPFKWYHVVGVVRGPADMSLYVNGVDDNATFSGSGGSVAYTGSAGAVGIYSNCSAGEKFSFPGKIDDVRFYNRALNASEAQRLYQLGSGAHTNASVQLVGALQSAPNPNSGLIGYYTFDGDKMKNNVADSSGQGNNGYLTSFTSTTTVQGVVGQALQFNGTSNYVDMGDVNAMDSLTAMTVSAWVKTNQIANDGMIIAKGSGSSATWLLFQDAVGAVSGRTNTYTFAVGNGVSTLTRVEGSTNDVTSGKWTHVVGVWQKTPEHAYLYINGVLDRSDTTLSGITMPNSAITVRVGDDATPGGNNYSGAIDDLRVYNRALSAAEIADLYSEGSGAISSASVQTSSATGNSLSTGLVGYYTFDGNNIKNNVADSSGAGNTGYLSGFTSTTTITGKIGQALIFPGASTIYAQASGFSGLGTNNQPYTVAAWIRANSASESGDIIHVSSSSNGSSWCLPFLQLTSGNAKTVSWNGGAVAAAGATTIAPNKWYHLVATWNAANGLTLYVNGVSDANTSQATFTGSGSSDFVTIGSTAPSGGGCSNSAGSFAGAIDDVRIYNRSLTASEVARLYQLGK